LNASYNDYCEEGTSKSGEDIFSTPERKTRTPNRSASKKMRTPLCTPNRSLVPPSPPYFRSPSLVESSVSSVSSAGAHRREDGTKNNKYVVFVDPTHPKRNREFDIERVCEIKHNGYKYNGHHVGYARRSPCLITIIGKHMFPQSCPGIFIEIISAGPY
jgi:hypothetical protein